MRVDFHTCCPIMSRKKASAKPFLECLGWPIATPEEGWKIEFVTRSNDPSDNAEQSKIGEVTNVVQTKEGCFKVCVEFTECLQGGVTKVVGWRRAILPDPSS